MVSNETYFTQLRQNFIRMPIFKELLTSILAAFTAISTWINERCAQYEYWQVIVGTVILVIVLQKIYDYIFCGIGGYEKTKRTAFRLIKKIPYVKRQIQIEVAKTASAMKKDLDKDIPPGMHFIKKLPSHGSSVAEVCGLAEKYKRMGHYDVCKGRLSGTIYNGGKELTELNSKIYEMFAWTNPLHSDVFPDIRKMEAEVVEMCVTMFNGGREGCGTMTSGGSESIMLACKAYRDRAIDHGIKNPEILAPRSAHAAFEKACQTFGIGFRTVPADPATMAVNVRKMKSMINRNTCMLVCSCPDFPMGIIDPIEQISELGLKYGIPVHVDACLGGFLVAFMEKAGYPLPLFDFRLPGVTSISCDTHKYGFAPKGSSVVLYRNRELRRYQYYVITDWPGGIYATSVFGGSRPGAIIAASWATLMYYGESGYVETTRRIIEAARYIRHELSKINGIFVYGNPLVSVITIGSLDFDILRLSAALSERGYNLNGLQFPSCFHLCCTLIHTQPGVADDFIAHVRDCTAEIMVDPGKKASGMAAIYGLSQAIPDRSLVKEMAMEYLDNIYNTDDPGVKTANGSGYGH